MEILKVLLSLIPSLIEAAKAGQVAWAAFLEARKVQGDDAVNAQLDLLKGEFTRLRVLAEYEAQPGPQA